MTSSSLAGRGDVGRARPGELDGREALALVYDLAALARRLRDLGYLE